MIVFLGFVIYLVSFVGTGLAVHRWQPEIDALPSRLSAMAALVAAPLLVPFGLVYLLVAVGLFGALLGFFGVALGDARARTTECQVVGLAIEHAELTLVGGGTLTIHDGINLSNGCGAYLVSGMFKPESSLMIFSGEIVPRQYLSGTITDAEVYAPEPGNDCAILANRQVATGTVTLNITATRHG